MIQKYSILATVFCGASLFALTSCNDFLDREPLSSITPEIYFSDES